MNEFIKKALSGDGVQNDASDVLDHEEETPFEASFYLESPLRCSCLGRSF